MKNPAIAMYNENCCGGEIRHVAKYDVFDASDFETHCVDDNNELNRDVSCWTLDDALSVLKYAEKLSSQSHTRKVAEYVRDYFA